jgi:hypothetical protein
MLTTETLTWIAQNWPGSSPASSYGIFLNADATPTYIASTNSQQVSYDDSVVTIFVVRPTDGTNYGPAFSLVRGNGISNTRAWLRSYIRKRTTDRLDNGATNILFTDDEINDYITQAVQDYSLRFPQEKDVTITLIAGGMQAGARDYQLPADYRDMVSVLYTSFNAQMQLWLKPLSFKGGETTSGTLVGYPKLGVLVPPMGGRFYGGNYDVYEGAIHLDFDPRGDGDTLKVRYKATIFPPASDVAPLPIVNEDMELVALFAESKVWEVIEGKDVRLSRWRSKEDGGRRDDLPTEKMSKRMRDMYEKQVEKRLSLRPKRFRLVRAS